MEASATDIVEGFQSSTEDRPVVRGIVTVMGLLPTDRTICLSFQSIDGFFHGGATIEIEGYSGALILVFESDYLSELNLSERELALRVRASSDRGVCPDDSPMLVAGWGRIRSVSHVSLFTRADLGERVHSYLDLNRYEVCKPIRGVTSALTAYNVICRFRVADICNNVAAVSLIWQAGVTRGDAIDAPLRAPCL
ncbi:MAG: hypothetical protein NXI21_02885 [Alphaproteobacteria bacterium]|nr:hypothetical protein [Alphaproteobacteria bacterium]